MRQVNDNSKRRASGGPEGGYTLIGLLVMIAVSGILMATIAPTWRYIVIRDREEELIFRGEQYKEAIQRYRAKFNALPVKLDQLVKERMIRRLYKDPMTGFDFELIYYSPAGNKRASELTPAELEKVLEGGPGSANRPIIGVVSTSNKQAIRPYKDKEFYNEWEFIAEEQQQTQQQPGQREPVDETPDR